MVRGGRLGGGTAYGQDLAGVPGRKRPGHRFGAALAAAGAPGRTTLTVAAPGENQGILTLALREDGRPGKGATAAAIPGATPGRQAGVQLGV
jgi:hypothetical protein